jgi:hypothetical protein
MASESTSGGPPPAPLARPRRLARRRGLPSGRSVLGAVLVVTAGLGTFATASARHEADRARYVVVTRSVAPGTRLAAGDLTLRPLGLDADTAQQAFRDPAALVGAVALGPLGAGQVLPRSGVALVGDTGRDLGPANELTIAVPAERLPPGLRRGETVAVLATMGSGADARTTVTVQGARVLGVGETDGTVTGRGSARLTVALADATDVVETAHAAHVAELSIVRTTFAAGALPATYPETPPIRATGGAAGGASTAATATAASASTGRSTS